MTAGREESTHIILCAFRTCDYRENMMRWGIYLAFAVAASTATSPAYAEAVTLRASTMESQPPSQTTAPSAIQFNDSAFEAAVRSSLGDYVTAITPGALASVTEIRSTQDIKVESLAQLSDFTRFYIGRKGERSCPASLWGPAHAPLTSRVNGSGQKTGWTRAPSSENWSSGRRDLLQAEL